MNKFKLNPAKGGLTLLLASVFGGIASTIPLIVFQIQNSGSTDFLTDPLNFSIIMVCQSIGFFGAILIAINGKFSNFKNIGFTKNGNGKDLLFSIILFVGVFLGLTVLNVLFMEFLGVFSYTATESPFPDFSKIDGFIAGVLTVAILPAFLEEILFRGILLNCFKKLGKWKAILLSSLMFSLFHGNPMQTVYQFALGVMLALIAWQTRNIWFSILIHFLNNFAVVMLTYLGYGDVEFSIVFIILGVVLTVLSFIYFYKRPCLTVVEVEEEEDCTEAEIEISEEEKRANFLLSNEKSIKAKGEKVMAIVVFCCLGLYFCFSWVLNFIQGLI